MKISRLLTAMLSCLSLLCSLTSVVAAQRRAASRVSSNAPRLVVQLGHSSFLNGFATFSRDGRLVATGSAIDASVIVWDVESGREVRRLAGNFGPEDAQDYSWMWGDFSPDGRLFAVGTEPFLRVWDMQTGKLVRQLTHDEHLFAPLDEMREPLSFSPDGRRLVAQGRARLAWDVATGRLLSRALIAKDDSFGRQLSQSRLSADGRLRVRLEKGIFVVEETASGQAVGRVRTVDEDLDASVSSPEVLAYALSPDARLLVTVTGKDEDHAIQLWDVKTGRLVRRLEGRPGDRSPFAFTARGEIINASSPSEGGGLFRVREMLGGRETAWRVGEETVTHFKVSPDGRLVALANAIYGEVYDAQTGARLARVEARVPANEAHIFIWDFVGFTPDQTVTFYKRQTPEGAQTFRLDTRDWTERPPQPGLDTLPLDNYNSYEQPFAMTPDTRIAAWEWVKEEPDAQENSQWVTVWNADPKIKNKTFRVDTDIAYNARSALALSPDGRRVAVATRNDGATSTQAIVKVYDADTGRALFRLRAPGLRVVDVAWSSDGRKLATFAGDGTLKLWDSTDGHELRRMESTADGTSLVRFSPDSRFLLAYGDDGFTRLYDVETGAELCRLMARADGDWIVLDPRGRFDTNNLDEVRGVHWVAPDDPLKPLPLEIFMRDYYEPRLLPRLLAGERFKPLRSLAELNRVQPSVEITKVEPSKQSPEQVDVTVEIARGVDTLRRSAGVARDTGVYDLRIFRDGQLVGQSPSNDAVAAPADNAADDAAAELRAWRESARLEFGADGRREVTFKNIRLPRKADVKELEFSAYAFNGDRVKSATDRFTYKIPDGLSPSGGRAYVISVGVNAYENPVWDLRFAANDARRLQEVVAARVAQEGNYTEIVRVPLISDYAMRDGAKAEPRVVTEARATKANFKAVLELLAGGTPDERLLRELPEAAHIKRATPEDLVIISFSSHGYADERGNFFLVPFDTGAEGRALRDVATRCISSDELSLWLRDVDAGELVMVVDACHSAASVQGAGFKPGPMGSRGLGQLSYDKGMRILTSTQADNVALESGLIEQGLLTYVLTHDGLLDGRADFKPQDKTITVGEWLAYGVARVPALHAEVERRVAELRASRERRSAALDAAGGARVVLLSPAVGEATNTKGLRLVSEAAKIQQPSLFDFARRRRETVLARTR